MPAISPPPRAKYCGSASATPRETRFCGCTVPVARATTRSTTTSTATIASSTATAADVQAVAASSAHLRILVGEGASSRVAHVRDTLAVAPETPALDIAREALVLAPDASAYDALARMRRGHVQLATVVDGDRLLGVVTLDDLLREVLPGAAEAELAAPAS